MHLIHIGRATRYIADSVYSIVESSRRPGLRSADTTSNTVLSRSLANDASVTLVQLPGTRCLTASSSPLALTDLNRLSILIYFVLLSDILLAPPDKSRAPQVRICICILQAFDNKSLLGRSLLLLAKLSQSESQHDEAVNLCRAARVSAGCVYSE